MDAAQRPKAALVYDFHKEIGLVNPSEGNGDNITEFNSPSQRSKQDKKKPRLTKSDQVLNCPRCNSTNTKFCYYNNYNPTQPRYLCKACRRFWTHGGTLRNVPVGGSSRKKIKPPLAPTSLSSNSKLFLDINPKPTTMSSSQFIGTVVAPTRSFMNTFNHDLNMGLYYANSGHHHFLPIPPTFELSASHGEGLSSYHVPMSTSSQGMSDASPRPYYPSSGFHFQDITKPTLNLCMDGGFGNTTTQSISDIEGVGRMPSPFGDQLKQDSTTNGADNNVLDQSNGHTSDSINGQVLYWNNNRGLYN